MNLNIYEINPNYISYLSKYAPHLFMNKQLHQQHERKYIGIVLEVNGFHYFAPLSSFKPKHLTMQERIDFIKIHNYSVININNMFPVPLNQYTYVDISKENNSHYKSLLQAEYRYIKSNRNRIIKNAYIVYNHKLTSPTETPLTRRCNDFLKLEKACINYQ